MKLKSWIMIASVVLVIGMLSGPVSSKSKKNTSTDKTKTKNVAKQAKCDKQIEKGSKTFGCPYQCLATHSQCTKDRSAKVGHRGKRGRRFDWGDRPEKRQRRQARVGHRFGKGRGDGRNRALGGKRGRGRNLGMDCELCRKGGRGKAAVGNRGQGRARERGLSRGRGAGRGAMRGNRRGMGRRGGGGFRGRGMRQYAGKQTVF